MEDTLVKLIEYFEQQLSLERRSSIKYTGEGAYLDALDTCKKALKEFRNAKVSECKHEWELKKQGKIGPKKLQCIKCGKRHPHI